MIPIQCSGRGSGHLLIDIGNVCSDEHCFMD